MPNEPQRRGPDRSQQVSAGKYLGHGLTWTASTLLFLFVGRALDRWWGTEPVLTLLGALVGAAAGLWSMYYHLVVEPDRERRRVSEEKGSDPRP